MIALLPRVALATAGIWSEQVMYHLRAILKGSEIRDHSVPVMLRQLILSVFAFGMEADSDQLNGECPSCSS